MGLVFGCLGAGGHRMPLADRERSGTRSAAGHAGHRSRSLRQCSRPSGRPVKLA